MQNDHEALSEYQELLRDGFDNLEEISRGGGGIIIKAHHKGLDKEVIIKKVIRSKVSALGKTGERDALKNLKHAYLPQIYDYIERGDDVFTVMEYIPGKSFAEVMKDRKKNFSKAELVKWTTQLCEVVSYLHSRKPEIIHCDIKPGNIMLTPEGNICLIDFNVSSIKTEDGLSAIGYTPGYAPAEQFLVIMERKKKRMEQATAAAVLAGNKAANGSAQTEKNQGQTDDDVTETDGTEIDATEVDGTEIDATEADGTEVDDATEVDGTEIDDVTEASNGPAAQAKPTPSVQAKAASTSGGQTSVSTGSISKVQPRQNGITSDQVVEMMKHENIPAEIDGRTDIYSVGATMYHIATGKKPSQFFEKNRPISELRPDLPDGLVYLITKAMMLRPQDRFKNSEEMLRVAKKIHKLDKHYKRLNRAENILALLFGLLMAGCVFLSIRGWNLMGVETHNRYESLVNQMAEARKTGDYGLLQQLYDEALAIYPDEASAYYEMAVFYYESKDYDGCLEYVVNEALMNEAVSRSEFADRFSYLAASSYFMMEEYEKSIPYYEDAINYHSTEASYYRDYVISLARIGETDRARKVLERARNIGVMEDVLLLLDGEIGYMEGRMEDSEVSLKECISKTSDNEVLVRAYGKLDDVYRQGDDETERYVRRMRLLEEATDKLPDEYGITLMERLAQVYMDYADFSSDNQYNEKAIQVFKKIRGLGLGYGTFQTDYNVAVLYEKSGRLDEAMSWLKKMLEERGEDYRWYKRLAYVELARQMKFENQDREYHTFMEYFSKAQKLYKDAEGRSNDVEMQILEERHRDLIDLGWLDE